MINAFILIVCVSYMTEKCGDNGIHDFEIIDDKEVYSGGDGEEMMKRQVRCKDCNRRATEYYAMIQRIETVDMYGEILD